MAWQFTFLVIHSDPLYDYLRILVNNLASETIGKKEKYAICLKSQCFPLEF